MESLKQFSIPVRGIGIGLHKFDFQIDSEFFEHFADSIIQEGNFKVQLEIFKSETMMDMDYGITGSFRTVCDRCLQPFDLACEGSHQLIAKFKEGESTEAEIVFIHPLEHEFNVAQYIYEFICLSIPMIKSHPLDEEGEPTCEVDIFDYLENDDEEQTEEGKPSVWDALKDLKKKD